MGKRSSHKDPPQSSKKKKIPQDAFSSQLTTCLPLQETSTHILSTVIEGFVSGFCSEIEGGARREEGGGGKEEVVGREEGLKEGGRGRREGGTGWKEGVRREGGGNHGLEEGVIDKVVNYVDLILVLHAVVHRFPILVPFVAKFNVWKILRNFKMDKIGKVLNLQFGGKDVSFLSFLVRVVPYFSIEKLRLQYS